MAMRVHRTCYKHRKLLTTFSILTRQSQVQLLQVQLATPCTTCTIVRSLHMYKFNSLSPVTLVCPSHHEEQITRCLCTLIPAPIQTKHVSMSAGGPQQLAVEQRRISQFKEEWERILEKYKVPEPFWSVKWIIEHVLRKHPGHSKVHIICISLSSERERELCLTLSLSRESPSLSAFLSLSLSLSLSLDLPCMHAYMCTCYIIVFGT